MYMDVSYTMYSHSSEDGFEIKPKYYSFNHFLFLTQVLSLQDVFLRTMFYLLFYFCVGFFLCTTGRISDTALE